MINRLLQFAFQEERNISFPKIIIHFNFLQIARVSQFRLGIFFMRSQNRFFRINYWNSL